MHNGTGRETKQVLHQHFLIASISFYHKRKSKLSQKKNANISFRVSWNFGGGGSFTRKRCLLHHRHSVSFSIVFDYLCTKVEFQHFLHFVFAKTFYIDIETLAKLNFPVIFDHHHCTLRQKMFLQTIAKGGQWNFIKIPFLVSL